MGFPDPVVEIAFGDLPLTPNEETSLGAADGATWTDVSAYVRPEIYIRRGRNYERNEIETGEAKLVLKNNDRRFDPDNASGPYYGDILPMVKIRIGADWSGTTYWLFHGYVERWEVEYQNSSNVSNVTLTCADAGKYFAMINVRSANRPQEQTDERIEAVLDALSWPAGERNIAVGAAEVATGPIDASALSIMQDAALVEAGLFYVSRNGYAVFEDQSFRDAASSIATWGDDAAGTELRYSTFSTRFDDMTIYNQVEFTRAGGKRQAASDTTSQDQFFARFLPFESAPFVDDTAALDAAEYYLARYKDARVRPDLMTIDPGADDSWAVVLDREISHMITASRTTLVDAAVTSYDAHIEAITWRIKKGLWLVTWQLSPHYTVTPDAGTLNTDDDWIEVDGGVGFQNSWVDSGGANVPTGYRKEGEWVYVRGRIKDGTIPLRVFTLPEGYRPPYPLRFAVDSDEAHGSVLIDTDGDLFVTFGVNTSVYLNGISFRVV